MADDLQPDPAVPVTTGGSDEDNPFAKRLADSPALGEVGFWDRAKANLEDSWMRGSLFGAGSLAAAREAVDDPGTSPRVRALMSTYLDQAAIDRVRYDTIPPARSAGENMAALLGQIGGGFGSPEGLVTHIPGVSRLFAPVADRFLGRVAESATTQGIINTATDPLVQAASIKSGAQDSYDWQRTAEAPLVGAAGGAILHAGAEGVGQAAKALAEAFRGRRSAEAPEPGPRPENLPPEVAKPSGVPNGESVFGPGDRIVVNDFSTGPDVPAGPYNGMSGTVVERRRNGYAVRLDDGTETFIGEMLLQPAPIAAAPGASPSAPAPARVEAPNAAAPVQPTAAAAEVPSAAGQPELPGTLEASPQGTPEAAGQAPVPSAEPRPAAAAEAILEPPHATETAAELKARLSSADGTYDMGAAGDRFVSEVGSALAEGKKVTIFPDGKPVEIVAIKDGMMADAKGQRWGTAPLVMQKDMNAPAVQIEPSTSKPGDLGAEPSVDQIRAGTLEQPPENVQNLIGQPIAGMGPHRVAAADGSSIDVAPVVIEAGDLIASSDAGYDPALQPRDRSRAASQTQIQQIAGSLDPERLGRSSEVDRGAPIVGPDGMVESGNGRVTALRSVYQQGGDVADRYRAWLAAHGVDVSAFREPVLVRQRLTPMTDAERQAFTVRANQAATLGMSASERAMADARGISDSTLSLIRNPDDLGAIANRDFVRAFINDLPASERAAMLTADGGLSAEGLARVRNAVLARAYGDATTLARVAEATSDEIKGISNALVATAPEWAKLRADIEAGKVRSDLDLTAELVEAVNRTADMRVKDAKLNDYLAQIDAFNSIDPNVERFMRMFADQKTGRAAASAKIAERLRTYAIEARKVSADDGLSLGLPKVTSEDLQKVSAQRGAHASSEADTPKLAFFGSGRHGARDAGDLGGRPGSEGARGGLGAPRAGGGESRESLSGGDIAFRKRTATSPEVNSTAGEHVADTGTPAESLQRQALALADELNMPLRQGRIQQRKSVRGQFDLRQGVARVREIPDIETVAHEAGHYVEKKVGVELSDMIRQSAAELGPIDYDQLKKRPQEGFAEFVRQYITAPAAAHASAPQFEQAFRTLLHDKEPEVLMALDNARAAYARWIAAPSGEKLAATVVRRPTDSIVESIKKDGMPATIGMVMGRAYEAVIDNRAPVRQAVRALARQAYEVSGNRMDLRGGKNPELLVRLLQRSHQASIADASYGVRPYHKITPEGPALRDAIVTALGKPSVFGSWDEDAVKEFSRYLVARRGIVLWDKYDRGDLPHRPMTLTRTDLESAIAEAEKANPGFAPGGTMVHKYTRQLLKKMFDGGLIGGELYGKLLNEPFYVPFFRDLNEKPLTNAVPPTGANMPEGPGTKQLIHRIRGSDRDIIDPLQSIMSQTLMVNRTLAHNDVLKSFVALARTAAKAGAESTGRILEEIPPQQLKMTRFDLGDALRAAGREYGVSNDDIDVLLGAMTDAFGGKDPIQAPVFKYERAKANGEPIMFWKEGGEMRAVRLIARDEGIALYESLVTLPSHARDIAMTLGSLAATTKRVGIVTNPIFALTNWVRDQLSSAIVRPDYIPFNPRGLWREVRQDQFAQLYAYAGGVSPGAAKTGLDAMYEGDVSSLAHKGWVTKKLQSIEGLVKHGNFVEFAKAIGEVAEVGEAGTRLNVMKQVFGQMQKIGLNEWDSMLEAAYQATDLMDFGRHGSGTEQIRRLIPFLNAHVIALDKAARTLLAPAYKAIRGDLVTENDIRDLRNSGLAWLKLAGVGGALGYLYGLFASKYEAYQDANDRLRASHLIVPGDAFGQPGVVLTIPKPFELAIGFNLGELLGLHAATGDPRVGDFAMHGLEEVLAPPIGLGDFPIISPGLQAAANYSVFTGRPIVPDRLNSLDVSEQFTGKTSPVAMWLGKELGMSPIKVDFLIGDTFGLWGRDLINVTNQLRDNAPEVKDTEMFGLRRILKDANVSSMATQQFWDQAGMQTGEFAKASNTYSAMLQQRRDGDAMEYLSHLPADKRAYVTLQQAADEEGKPVFKADEKRLHPYTRAATAALLINDYIRQIETGSQFAYDNGQPFDLSPTTKRALIDNMRQLQAMEQRNALVIMQAPGYSMRKTFSTEDQFDVIMAIDPKAGTELATRYATAKILPTEAVAKAWPEAQRRLVQDGSNADLGDLAAEAGADGYAFGAERVTKPRKRRVAIPGESATAP